MSGKIEFSDEKLEKLRLGECIEEEIDGQTVIICGHKADYPQEDDPI